MSDLELHFRAARKADLDVLQAIRVATVASGGDPGHAPARRAYEKAGFNVTIPSVWMCRTL